MRITAGEFRSRRLKVPQIEGVRPTTSRVREALFNILGDIDGQRVLDLFSGSGVMAVEALSRGANVVSIEKHGKACRCLTQVAEQFNVQQRWHIQCAELPNGLQALAGQSFDWVFADPPYACGMAEQVPVWLQQADIHTPRLIIEETARVQPLWPQGWHVSTRKYGATCLHFLEKEPLS